MKLEIRNRKSETRNWKRVSDGASIDIDVFVTHLKIENRVELLYSSF